MGLRGPNTGWTDERTEQAKTLYLDGSSCAQVARAIRVNGEFEPTRNAVISKMHRLKVSRSPGAEVEAMRLAGIDRRLATPKRMPPAPKLALVKPQPDRPEAPPVEFAPSADGTPLPKMGRGQPADAEPVAFGEAARFQCSWPIGPTDEPGSYDMLVCGAKREACGPYCPTHAGRAFNTAPKKPYIARDPNVTYARPGRAA